MRRALADRASVANYAAQPSSSPVARAYLRLTRSTYRGIRRILDALKRRLR